MSAERAYAQQEEKKSKWPTRLLVGGIGVAVVGWLFDAEELIVVGVVAAGAGAAAMFWGRRNKGQ